VLQELAASSGETAVVLRRVALDAFLVHQVEAPQQLRVTLDPETRVPLWAGAFGQVLLAWAPDDVVDAALVPAEPGEGNGRATTGGRRSATGATARRRRTELARVASAGVTDSQDELAEGSVSIAAPILAADGIVGAIGIVGPAFRCDDTCIERVRRSLPELARTIAESLAADPT
jgi:DNA-binding IclR family transcriptional regulator